jgi:hypothetical protein
LKGGIEFEVVWSDMHMSEFHVSCSNGRFSGSTRIYINHDDMCKMAEALKGFPSHATDTRDFELGTFKPSHADGGIRMHFYCRDSVGHAVVDIRLRGDACPAMGEPESVSLRIPIEAAAIDSFLVEAAAMDTNEVGAKAFLHMQT